MNEEKTKERDIQKARATTVENIEKITSPSKNTGPCYLATHVAKFTDSNIPATVAWYSEDPKDLDSPYLSFVSVQTQDVDGIYASAAYCRPVKLLCATTYSAWRVDGNEQIRTHLINDDALAKEIFGSSHNATYEETRRILLSIPACPPPKQTSQLLRQIYFPIKEQGTDHLLSVLPSSVLINEMRRRYENRLSSISEAKKKNEPYSFMSKPIAVQFGGQYPQNVSAIAFHASHGGFPAFNSCAPNPNFSEENLPYGDFFRWCFHSRHLLDDFLTFFKTCRQKNYSEKLSCIRARDAIFDAYIEEIYRLRSLEEGWSAKENLHLPLSQRRILDAACVKDLEDRDFFHLQEAAQAAIQRSFDILIPKKSKISFDAKEARRLFAEPLQKELRICFA